MNDSANPYVTPQQTDPATEVELEGLSRAQRKRLEIGGLIVAWEKRRLWFNALLANLCFCAGSLVEGYWNWFINF